MSNVLIGIIGVILFIGLALAGALFLGPRFQESTNNSKASAVIQVVDQVAKAANMQVVQEGVPVAGNPSGADDAPVTQLVSRGYLKSKPLNPIDPTYNLGFVAIDGSWGGVAAWSITGLPTPSSKGVCAAIARQSGLTLQADGSPPTGSAPPSNTSGCFLANGWGPISGIYIAYSRL